MTNEEIIAHCILFFIAGYDTTASVNDPENTFKITQRISTKFFSP